GEGQVEFGGVGGGEAGRALGAATADDQRRVGLLHRLGQRRAVLHLVVPPVEVEGLADRRVPESGEDGELLLQALEALTEGREREGVGGVLGVVPARAEAELDPSAAHRVDLRHLDGEQAGRAESRRRHERAEPDALGLAGDTAQRDPGVGRARQAVPTHGEEVVRAEERVEALLLGPLCDGEQLVVGGALLGLDEDPELHGRHAIGHGPSRRRDSARQSQAGQTASMDIGVVFPQTEVGYDPGAVRAVGQAVDDLGYTHLAAYDHVLGGDTDVHGDLGGPYTIHHPFREPLTMFAYLAGCTNLGFATSILIGPQRQTALLAKQAAEVDLLCEGRFRLGLGIGWNKVEYDALGVPFEDRAAILEEQVAVLRALWTRESVTTNGRFHRITAAGIAPLPAQRPIPIWIGAFAPAALRRVGRVA